MNNNFLKRICGLTLLTFTTTTLYAGNLKENIKIQHQLERTVNALSDVRINHGKSASAMMDGLLKVGVEKALASSMSLLFAQSEELPTAKLEGNLIKISLRSKELKVSLADVASDKIVIDGKSYFVNPKLGFQENVNNVYKELKKNNEELFGSRFSLLPFACASDSETSESSSSSGLFGMSWGTILGIVALALGAFALYKTYANNSEIDTLKTRVGELEAKHA